MGVDTEATGGPRAPRQGVAGLRVADASVMPSVPSANINASVLATAERAASLITN